MAKVSQTSINKMRNLKQLERKMPEPHPNLVERVLQCLDDFAVPDVDRSKLEDSARKIAAAIEFYGECNVEGDVHFNADVEHAMHMAPRRRIRELAHELLQLLPEGDRHYENVHSLYREAHLIEGILERSYERRRPELCRAAGDPANISRYKLYVEVMGAWWQCKQTADDIPPRTVDSLGYPEFLVDKMPKM